MAAHASSSALSMFLSSRAALSELQTSAFREMRLSGPTAKIVRAAVSPRQICSSSSSSTRPFQRFTQIPGAASSNATHLSSRPWLLSQIWPRTNSMTSDADRRLAQIPTKNARAGLAMAYMQRTSPLSFRFSTSPRFFSSSPTTYFSRSTSLRATQSSQAQAATHGENTKEDSPADGSLRGKLKTLMKKYGWAAVVVYLLIGFVDFGVAFFAINLVGADHVRHATDYVLDYLVYGKQHHTVDGSATEPEGNGILGFLKDWREKHKAADAEQEADEKKSGNAGSLWATAALAYTIHKTLFLPLRLGAVATATPAIVKQLQRWGINIARAPIPEAAKARSAKAIKTGRDRIDKAREKHGDWL